MEIKTIIDNLVALLNGDLYSSNGECFDCELWEYGYATTDDQGNIVKDNNGKIIYVNPVKTAVSNRLNEIKTKLDSMVYAEAEDPNKKYIDYGYRTQIQRLYDVVEQLQSKINSIQCPVGACSLDIMPDFLAQLIMTVLQLINSLELLNGLETYRKNCGCLGESLFSLLMGKFINGITDLQNQLGDWNSIVMAFFQMGMSASKSYVASYMPNSSIQVQQYSAPMGHACVPCPTPRTRPVIQRQYVDPCGCNPCGNGCHPCC